jgi:O-methyltransferase involved in polyketide biosynthesis
MPFDHAKISITAKLTAYLRGFSDIPFAAEAAELVHARAAFDQLLRDGHLSPDDLTWYAPILEARSKSIDETIRRSGVCQVLELAGELSLRGLAMSAIPNLRYVETDLPEMIAEKTALIAEIVARHRLPPRENLRLIAADALDLAQLLAAASTLHAGQPVAIVHEGLLQYLTATETETVARHVHQLLEKHGGVWITPDFAIKADAENVSAQQLRFRRTVAAAAGRTMYNNAFNDTEHVIAYFANLGFQVEVFSQSYLAPHLVSPDRVHLRPGFWDELKPRLHLWVLKIKR